MSRLTAVLKENGFTPRQKKWGGRKYNIIALTSDDSKRVVQFLQSVAEEHALVLTGRIPGFRRTDVNILPSSEMKKPIWTRGAAIAAPQGKCVTTL
ncbi:hypothetical protein ACOMHN_066079 [Nucella lapillus]